MHEGVKKIIDRGILEIGEDCWKAEKRISRYARGNAQGIKSHNYTQFNNVKKENDMKWQKFLQA